MFYIFPRGSLTRKIYQLNINPNLFTITGSRVNLSQNNTGGKFIYDSNYQRFGHYNKFTSTIVTNNIIESCTLIEKPFDEYKYKIYYAVVVDDNVLHNITSKYMSYMSYNMYSLNNVKFEEINRLFMNNLKSMELI